MEPHDVEPLTDGLESLPEEALDLGAAPEELREAVWRETARQVRTRPRRRWRIVAAVTAAVGYAAGLATMALVSGQAAEPDTLTASAPVVPAETALPVEASAAVPEPDAGAHLTARQILDPAEFARLVAEASKEDRVTLYTQAGDYYLNIRGDIGLATRCYRRALWYAAPEERALVRSTDSWLLTSLKTSQQQEKIHENQST